eukprot:7343400-Pyramimonas_sp.AAC.1
MTSSDAHHEDFMYVRAWTPMTQVDSRYLGRKVGGSVLIVTIVGVRGTIPKANDEAPQKLGVIDKRGRGEAQVRLAREAIKHLNRILRLRERLAMGVLRKPV